MTPNFASCDLCDAHKTDLSGNFRVLPPVMRDFGALRKFCGPVVTVKCFEDNTLVKAASALKEHGALSVTAYCTHPVLSGGAVARVAESELDELVVTDTIPLTAEAQGQSKIRVLSCAQLLAETILRINRADSVSSLFVD